MSDLPNSPRRFVAGATCSQCHASDKIIVFRLDGILYRECVACAFQDEMRFAGEFRELETRVNRTEQEREQETQVLRVLN